MSRHVGTFGNEPGLVSADRREPQGPRPAPPIDRDEARLRPIEAQRLRRERSTIQFPYGSLNDAVDIAQALGQSAATGSPIDDLASRLGYFSSSNGSFRLKLSTARTFGVIGLQNHSASLTPLGRRLLEPGQRRQARVEAFLGVPLYRLLFERFADRLLPQDVAIEAEMVKLGVAPKQRDKARQAFQRSARQAGLFFDGRDHLAIPPDLLANLRVGGGRQEYAAGVVGRDSLAGDRPNPTRDVHPAIQGLLHMLPPAGAAWPERQQDQWLAAMKNIFGLIYVVDGPH